MNATMARESDIREQIKTVISRLDRIDSRVKHVEIVAASVPKLEKTLSKVESRVESQASMGVGMGRGGATTMSAPPPVKAFVSGASIGFLLLGAVTAAWILGFF